jgi:cobalt/nickel transport system permease protein
MYAMHAPDGFLEPTVALATAVISVVVLVFALRQSRRDLQDKQLPLAGIAAAFIFAAQMFNFPVASGTTGHLLGGALAAILLGPATGSVVVTIVVVVQALLFADGGLSALGYNVLNMAIVPAFGGYALFLLFRRIMPKNSGGIVGATGLAAALSVVLSAMAFSIEWLFGASAPIAFDDVFTAMVGVHLLIGIGEGLISALAIAAVLASRPDLVYGIRDLDQAEYTARTKVSTRTFVIGGVVTALLFAVVVSQFAADDPDGLEKVSIDEGFADQAQDHALGDSIFADYATSGIDNESLSLAIAGACGVVLTLVVGFGLFSAVRRGRQDEPDSSPAVV